MLLWRDLANDAHKFHACNEILSPAAWSALARWGGGGISHASEYIKYVHMK